MICWVVINYDCAYVYACVELKGKICSYQSLSLDSFIIHYSINIEYQPCSRFYARYLGDTKLCNSQASISSGFEGMKAHPKFYPFISS